MAEERRGIATKRNNDKKKRKRGERNEKKRGKIVLNDVAEENGVVVAWQMRGEAFRSRKSKDIDTITLPRANYQSA